MTAEETVREYYAALREGEPIDPFFSEAALTKFGVSEALHGYDAIVEGLREQSRTTAEWEVQSERLQVRQRDRQAWFSDEVRLAWTDTTTGTRQGYDTRWSGTLQREADGDGSDANGDGGEADWQFVLVHVSAPRTL